jgi:hypothetical protein
MSNMQYLPLTNELVYKQNGQGQQLFKKYGYHIPHPRYQDYYHGLQQYGPSFADDLTEILGGLATGLGRSGVFGSSTPAYSRSAPIADYNGGMVQSQISGLGSGDSGIIGSIPALSFAGDQRQARYHELLQHFYDMSQQQDSLLPGTYPLDLGYTENIAFQQPGNQANTMAPAMQADPEKIFGIDKRLFAIGLLIVGVIIYKSWK